MNIMNLFLFAITGVLLFGCASTALKGDEMKTKKPSGEKVTIVGVLHNDDKFAPYVNGTYLMDLADPEKYEGKKVEVTGNLYEGTEYVVKAYDPKNPDKLISQGFEGEPPLVMRNVSIKIVK